MERSAVTPANNNLAISFGSGSLLSFQDLVQKMWNSETFVFRGSSGRTESVNNPINHSLEEKPTGRIVREKGNGRGGGKHLANLLTGLAYVVLKL